MSTTKSKAKTPALYEIDQDGVPIFNVVAVKGRDSWGLSYRCPWCKWRRGPGRHHHGGGRPDEKPFGGSRNNHCLSPEAPGTIRLRIVAIQDEHGNVTAVDEPVLER